jgi:hypothetical protein
MSKLITGIFTSRVRAEQAVDELMRAGFATEDVSLLMSESTQGREFAIKRSTKAPEAAATGAALGGVLGAVAAGLAAVGSITVPGLALVAAGPVVAALTGLGVGAAAGGLTGALIGLGVPEHEAKFYAKEIEKGGILVGVYSHNDKVELARDILNAAGADKVTKGSPA